jgi:Lon protease-like protein
MGGADGGERLFLQVRPQVRDVPFLFLTGSGVISQAVRSTEGGPTDYVKKPFELTFLLERIARRLALQLRMERAELEPRSKGERSRTRETNSSRKSLYPVLPLLDIVVFPHQIAPLLIRREKSVRALEDAIEDHEPVLLVAQKNAVQGDPARSDIYSVGTISAVLQLLKLPDGTVKVLVQGGQRARIRHVADNDLFFQAFADTIEESGGAQQETEALARTVIAQFERYMELSRKIPPEALHSISQIEDPGKLADVVASFLQLEIPEKQELLETGAVAERLDKILRHMAAFSPTDTMDLPTDRGQGKASNELEPAGRKPWPGPSAEERLAFLKAELDITDAQTALWDWFAEAARDLVKAAARRGSHPGIGVPPARMPPVLLVRLAMREGLLAEQLEVVREWKAVIEPFYAALSEAQKAGADRLMMPLFAV